MTRVDHGNYPLEFHPTTGPWYWGQGEIAFLALSLLPAKAINQLRTEMAIKKSHTNI